MGVEYQHWIVVADPSFIPWPESAGRVHDVLTEWGLGGALELYDLGSGGAALRGTLNGPPANALLVYRDSVEGEVLEAIGAEVLDDSGDTAAGGYVARRLAVLSEELHVLGSSEEIHIQVIQGSPTPTQGHRKGLWESHWAPKDALLRVRARSAHPLPFTGLFRAAVILDFGKSIPAVALMDERKLDPDFVEAIAKSLGAPVVEFGFFY